MNGNLMALARTQRFSSPFRLLAVVATFLWVLAQSWCFQHCSKYRVAMGSSACCSKSLGQSGEKSAPDAQAPCGMLKLVRVQAAVSLPPLPQLELSAAPSPMDLSTGRACRTTTANLDLPVRPRGVPRVDFVFVPEVCLGAALRSVAPPTEV